MFDVIIIVLWAVFGLVAGYWAIASVAALQDAADSQDRIADAAEGIAESVLEIAAALRKPDPQAIDKTAEGFQEYMKRSVSADEFQAVIDLGFPGDTQ